MEGDDFKTVLEGAVQFYLPRKPACQTERSPWSFADCLRKVKFIPCFYSMHFIDYQKFFRSDEGLTLETSAFQSLYGGQFTLSTLLINEIFVYQKFCSFETSSF